MARKLEIEIVGDASSFKRALGDSDSATGKFGKALGGMAKAGVLAAGAAGIGAVFVTLKAGIGEFTQATKVAAQTEAVLKSTGGVANVTAKGMDELSSSIMHYSGVDDEAIKQGQNLLLSFTNIRNEAGKGNDIFDRLTKTMVDYSVRTGKDATSASLLLGKALEDPATKLSSLSRAGISFTKQQKDMVKAMVESGDTLGAQRFVLEELEKRYGGAAKAAGDTLPGKLNILKESFNNLAGDLVAKAVPAVTSFVSFLADEGLPKIEEAFGKLGTAIAPAMDALGNTFASAGPAIMGVIEPLAGAIRDNLLPIFVQLQEIAGNAITQVSAIIKANGPALEKIFQNLGEVISNLARIVLPLLEFAFTKILPVAIKVLIPLLVAVTEVLAQITTAVRIVHNMLTSLLVPAFNASAAVARALQGVYENALAPAFGAIGEVAKIAAGVLKGIVVPAFNAVHSAADAVRDLFGWFSDKAGAIFRKLAVVLVPAVEAITAPFYTFAGALQAVISAIDGIVGRVDDIVDAASAIRGAVGGLVGKIPGLAAGGPVEQGRAYIVGEQGPELFVPGMNGTIVPNLQSPSSVGMASAPSGGAAVINLNFYGPAVGTDREFQDLVRRALYDVQRRNPALGFT